MQSAKSQKNKMLFELPIAVQTCLRIRWLAIPSSGSYSYHFQSRAASTNTDPAPDPAILAGYAG